jgi:hypothetical protein
MQGHEYDVVGPSNVVFTDHGRIDVRGGEGIVLRISKLRLVVFSIELVTENTLIAHVHIQRGALRTRERGRWGILYFWYFLKLRSISLRRTA